MGFKADKRGVIDPLNILVPDKFEWTYKSEIYLPDNVKSAFKKKKFLGNDSWGGGSINKLKLGNYKIELKLKESVLSCVKKERFEVQSKYRC